MRFLSWDPLTKKEKNEIEKELIAFEEESSSPLLIHLDKYCKSNALYKAENIFMNLGLAEQEERKALLIYVAVKERKFAVVGDKGLNARIDSKLYESIGHLFVRTLKDQGMFEALMNCVKELKAITIKEILK